MNPAPIPVEVVSQPGLDYASLIYLLVAVVVAALVIKGVDALGDYMDNKDDAT